MAAKPVAVAAELVPKWAAVPVAAVPATAAAAGCRRLESSASSPTKSSPHFRRRATPQAIDQIARQYDLTQLESQSFPLTGRTFYRWRIGGGRSVADVVRAIERERIVASAQPNYIFTLQEDAAKVPAATHGDASQYVLGKLQVEQAHQVATGRNVRVALVDSEVDVKHPDLVGTTAKGFDALGGEENPDRHGTAMAGAIGAHGKLLGIAPDAQLLTARAFGETSGAANGTSFAIYKGLQWAADNAARVVNMSFAGARRILNCTACWRRHTTKGSC